MNNKNKKSLFYVSLNILAKSVIIPILIIYILSNLLIIKYAVNDMINSNKSLLVQISDRTNSNLDLGSVVIANIANNPKIHTYISQWSQMKDGFEKSVIKSDIDILISANLNHLSVYEGVIFNLKDGIQYTYGKPEYPKNLDLKSKNNRYIYNKVNLVNDYIYNDNVVLTIPINNRATVVESVMLVINEDMFKHKELLSDSTLKDMYIKSRYEDRDLKDKKNIEYGKFYYYDVMKLECFDLSIVAKYELTSVIVLIVKLIGMIFLGYIFIILALAIYYQKYKNEILNPIEIVVDKIKKMRRTGEFNEIFEENNIREIDSLNSYLNSMIRKVNRLMNENKKINEEKLNLEIDALQSQITPHFIFNTLNSIRIQAMINGDKELSNNIKSFSSLIEGNFTKGNIHSFEEEVKYIESYYRIMKLRYGEKINTTINIEECIKDKKVLKLIIQPVIENSIIHGLAVGNYVGNISIDIYKNNNKIIVEIMDNGIGITKEKAIEILSGECSGIGVYNSDRRIKIYYGEKYGMKIESKFGEYTKTIITLPII